MSDLREKSIVLLGSASFSVQSTGATTLYTVPVGKRCILDNVKVVCGSAASPTAHVSVGQVGTLTDFIPDTTCTNLAAQYDMIRLVPIPTATTPLKSKSYAAGTVIQLNVATLDADGGTDNTAYLFGTIY